MSAAAYPDDNQLAGLIQAATAAAGQEQEWQDTGENTSGAQIEHGGHSASNLEPNGDAGVAYTHEINASQIDPSIQGQPATTGSPLRRLSTRKRKRAQSPTPTSETHQTEGADPPDRDSVQFVDLADARAAGVHSATALFRQPSASSKKYTRPPMSKMFTSLEISPENFLHLQAAAKNYMLDPDHPGRRDCVGQRGRGDIDMVKLKLWNCVKDFLGKEGNGERFFGENTVNEGMSENKYIWPRDDVKIIKLAMPLLRRMVTNERQRQYANNTRKGGDRRHDGILESHDTRNINQFQAPTQLSSILGQSPLSLEESDSIYTRLCSLHDLERFYEESYLMPDDFKSLIISIYSHYHNAHGDETSQCTDECACRFAYQVFTWDVFSRFTSEHQTRAFNAVREVFELIKASFFDILSSVQGQSDGSPLQHPPQASVTHNHTHDPPPVEGQFPLPDSITLQINILRNQKRIFGLFNIIAPTCPTFTELKRTIAEHHAETLGSTSGSSSILNFDGDGCGIVMKAWLPHGLVTVETEEEWVMTFWSAARVDWMDGVMKVLVEVPSEGPGE